MTTWKTGDTVKLKSGGPRMTVRNQESGDEVICDWFEGVKAEAKVFHPDQLTGENPSDNDASAMRIRRV
jgi:uncharacterized protein YodC (DUF2158 family)